MKPLRYGSRLVWIFAPAAMAAAILALSFMITPAKPSTERKAVWDAHNALCLQTPLSLYSRDRARLVRGTILDPAGLPVAGADVRCLNSKGLERLLRMGPKLLREWESSDWAEARTVTNAEGVFEFPHLPEGSRMFCFSKPGFAPVTRGLIPVQDGLGARIDATLSKPKQLRLRWSRPQSEIRRIALIPYRWSPAPRIADIQPDATSATFSDLGGPFRKVAVLGLRSNDEENPRVLKIVDLDQTQDADLGDLKLPPSANTDVSIVLDEAEDLETWAKAPAEAHRVFYGMLNPWAAFWREFPSNHRPPRSLTASMPKPATEPPQTQPATTTTSTATTLPSNAAPTVAQPAPMAESGLIRGFGIGAYCPVLLESVTGDGRIGWTSTAAEFEFGGLPPGDYRIRALGAYGVEGFARGLRLPPHREVKLETGFDGIVKRDDKTSREVMGTVYWENGAPAADSEVLLQNAADFRYYLERTKTDANGFFRFAKVAADASYFLFAMPPGASGSAMKRFTNFSVESNRRELWFDLELSPHRVAGRLPSGTRASSLRLLQVREGQPDQFLWETQVDPLGNYDISNVAHGRFRAVAIDSQTNAAIPSLPFDIQEGRAIIEPQWPPQTGADASRSQPAPAP